MGNSIFQDWKANKDNFKGQLIMVLFRLAQKVHRNKILFCFFFLYLIFYRFFVEWLLCVELPWKAQIGPGLGLYHGHALVLNPQTVIGSNCTLRQSTTIGNKEPDGKAPVIGNQVNIGANVCIIGDISIGDNVIIGAGSVVVKDIPANCVVGGNPAKIIRQFM